MGLGIQLLHHYVINNFSALVLCDFHTIFGYIAPARRRGRLVFVQWFFCRTDALPSYKVYPRVLKL